MPTITPEMFWLGYASCGVVAAIIYILIDIFDVDSKEVSPSGFLIVLSLLWPVVIFGVCLWAILEGYPALVKKCRHKIKARRIVKEERKKYLLELSQNEFYDPLKKVTTSLQNKHMDNE
jgi:hypothetical protein